MIWNKFLISWYQRVLWKNSFTAALFERFFIMRKPPFYKSLWNSVHGIFWMLKNERNFQLEMLAFLLNLFLIVYLQLSAFDAALIFLVCFLVLSLEIINTAIEKICDIVQPEYDERIKIIKDISAGAVFIAAVCAVIVGIFIYPKYF